MRYHFRNNRFNVLTLVLNVLGRRPTIRFEKGICNVWCIYIYIIYYTTFMNELEKLMCCFDIINVKNAFTTVISEPRRFLELYLIDIPQTALAAREYQSVKID